MLHLNLRGVDVFIDRSNKKKLDAFWQNYDLVIWHKNNGGFSDIKGMYRKDAWGIAEKISVNEKGIWILPKKYVKYFK